MKNKDWKKVKLGEVVEIIGGGTPKTSVDEYWNGEIPWLSVADFNTGKKYVYEAAKKITELGLKNSSAKILKKDQLIISARGTVGVVAMIGKPMAFNQSNYGLDGQSGVLDNHYLYYLLAFLLPQLKSNSYGAVFNSITRKTFDEISFRLPPLAEQKAIAAQLDRADKLRQDLAQSLADYDRLLAASFLDMFGDPVLNPKGWEVVKLGELAKKVGSGSTPKGGQSVYDREGYYFIRSQNVRGGRVDYSDMYYISEEIHHKMKRTWLEKNDVLLNITGASIGRVAIYDRENHMGNVNQHVCIIRLKKTAISSYILYTLSNANYQAMLMNIAGGGTREAFNFKQIKAFPIPLPPLPLQQQFAQLVERIERQKALIQSAQQSAEDLFGALLQAYFYEGK
ncbi:restriction endonuclease subunit S [Saprospira grandis]|uniref:restriction endonuclease subunit S n=1 Tax=Saprospira grandis TaxID=1008 RepID=UPI0022DCE811|nr:restriction endonuclease subunit S [Saprospira grandis]WBM74179.1 restriction endonuclease subunit S [Saprospira grandis]